MLFNPAFCIDFKINEIIKLNIALTVEIQNLQETYNIGYNQKETVDETAGAIGLIFGIVF